MYENIQRYVYDIIVYIERDHIALDGLGMGC